MRIDLVFPALPPALNGIGDHTARLADALAPGCRVRIWTDARSEAAVAGAEVVPALGPLPGGVRGLEALADDPPDWLLVQYNPFSYGRWGLNPFLPATLRGLRRSCPGLRVALMVHEPFVPVTNWKWAIETTWQRAQLWALGRLSDLVLCSIEPWAQRFERWFPHAPVRHLPVGSNIPDLGLRPADAKRHLGLDGALVLGVFGSAHPSRLLPFVRRAAGAVAAETDAVVLYVGPDGDRVRAGLRGLPLRDAGPLPGPDVSRHLAAMDLHLAPFEDGVSTRRGSFMAGIQHGVPTVSTHGAHTDDVLRRHAPGAFRLVPDDDVEAFVAAGLEAASSPEARAQMGEAARTLYAAEFAWDQTAATLLRAMDAVDDRHAREPAALAFA